jgi:hypothetical protein
VVIVRRPCGSVVSSLALLALLACGTSRTSNPAGAAPGASPDTAAASGTAGCPTYKLAFTRETGCQNDGAVEFCMPKDAPAAHAEVKRIAPSVSAMASRGRAGCDTATETLFLYPTNEAACTSRHGALTDTAWNELCQLAALPEIRRIVPTWYE